jgi:hypothetical protein
MGSAGLLVAAAALLGSAAVALPVLLHMPWWLGLPVLPAAALAAWLAWRGRAVWALLAAVPLYVALLQIELPNLTPLWIAPRMAALLRTWPGYAPSGANLAASGFAEPSMMFLAGPHIFLLPTGKSAAVMLAHGKAAAIVNDDDRSAFEAEAARLGLAPRDFGRVAGYNYSRGNAVILTLFVR